MARGDRDANRLPLVSFVGGVVAEEEEEEEDVVVVVVQVP